MAFKPNPMENYNRNNPFVVRAKAKYNELSALYENLVRTLIKCSIMPVMASIAIMISTIIAGHIGFGICMILIYILTYGVIYTYTLKYTIRDPANDEIEKVTQMEMSDILNINIETVDNAIGILSECIGKTNLIMDLLPKMSLWFYCSTVVICDVLMAITYVV